MSATDERPAWCVLTCSSCDRPIPDDAPRSVGEDDTVWCVDCYESAMHTDDRPKPSVPKKP